MEFDDPDVRLAYEFKQIVAVDDTAFAYTRLWMNVEILEDGVASSDMSDIAKAWARKHFGKTSS